MKRYVFDGPAAPREATWYVGDLPYRHGDSLPYDELMNADGARGEWMRNDVINNIDSLVARDIVRLVEDEEPPPEPKRKAKSEAPPAETPAEG